MDETNANSAVAGATFAVSCPCAETWLTTVVTIATITATSRNPARCSKTAVLWVVKTFTFLIKHRVVTGQSGSQCYTTSLVSLPVHGRCLLFAFGRRRQRTVSSRNGITMRGVFWILKKKFDSLDQFPQHATDGSLGNANALSDRTGSRSREFATGPGRAQPRLSESMCSLWEPLVAEAE